MDWLERALRHLLPSGIALSVVVRDDCTLSIDAPRIQQALLNLVINARDAMPSGGRLTLSADRVEVRDLPSGWNARPGLFGRISIEDTGCAIDTVTLELIFEPFFTTKTDGKGTGLGLAMTRAVVRDAAGFLEAISSPGAGTSFQVYLPCEA